MRGQDGYTLLEVVVSILLTAVMVAAIMSVALSSKRGSVKTDRKIIANEASRQLAARLKGYVTADSAQSTVPGPGLGAGGWKLPGDSQSYALACGAHAVDNGVSGILPAWFAQAPYNATVAYTVTCVGGVPPKVDVTVNWSEP